MNSRTIYRICASLLIEVTAQEVGLGMRDSIMQLDDNVAVGEQDVRCEI